MIASRNFYVQLVVRVIFLTLIALGVAFLFLEKQYLLSSLCSVALMLQTIYIIGYVNHTNRKIAYFFESIKNEDFTLRFPEHADINSLKELNRSLNMLNGMIQKVHLENQAQEKYYQEIIKQADMGILTFNKKGHILFANMKMEELLNHKPLNHIKQLDQIDPSLYGLFQQLKPFDRKLVQLTNERERKQIALKATSLVLNKEEVLLVVAQDINRELEEKETDSWVRLIRVLAHEIMNTITPITSISESILKYYKSGKDILPLEEIKEDHIRNTIKGLEVIREQGADLMAFVTSYRSILSLPAPDKALVTAHRLLNKVKVLMDQENGNDAVHISTAVEPGDLELFIDEKQLSHVLINLGKNALQALGHQENGRILLQAGINLQGQKYIEVRDNGPGVDPELVDEIFVPFFTTKTGGTGIGLSLSKQIMHLHGGYMKLHSVPARETSFFLYFQS
ncbi:MAG: ATP-binding protein [Sediminicola sp.]|tara:strand:- start:24755 stop:26113 length:1359 start_codon:yes stop_codon:yes gene_type:complete